MDVKFIDLDGELAVVVLREDLADEDNQLLLAKFLGARYHEQSIMVDDEDMVESIQDSLEIIDEEGWGMVVFNIVDERLWVGDGEIF